MLSVVDALTKITNLMPVMPVENVDLRHASGRVLAETLTATRDQPPFSASSMDGYAINKCDLKAGNTYSVIGESSAGSAFNGTVGSGDAVRIFTGAPLPAGADKVVIQEDVTRVSDTIMISNGVDNKHYIRPQGDDFSIGDTILAPRILTPEDVALIASMNIPYVPVRKKPIIALLATGDELVMPGDRPTPDQIIASNSFGLAALLEHHGADIRLLPIARDTADSLKMALRLAKGADLIVTIGGASVGEYDIVHSVATELGLDTEFYKVAMRPGKPLMAGRLNGVPMIGLPGNPVSSMVCGHVFIRPAIDKMLGQRGSELRREKAILRTGLGGNSNREHYMRAKLKIEDGSMSIKALDRQDSGLLSVLSRADALLVRKPGAPAQSPGDIVEFIRL